MTVIGAGSWGTALAIQLAREGHSTQLWGRDRVQLDAMRHSRRNARYLPDAVFPDLLQVAADLGGGTRECAGCVDRRALACISLHLGRHRAALET